MAADDRRKVVASNLPSDMSTDDDVALFFESRSYCPDGGDVGHVEMNVGDQSAVVTFQERSGRNCVELFSRSSFLFSKSFPT